MTIITYETEWNRVFRGETRGTRASHRATTSSKTPGKVNRGTVYKRERSGIDWTNRELCFHGQPMRRCDECSAWCCTCPGVLPHRCEGKQR